MANIQPITQTAFNDKRWRRTTNYLFAKDDAVSPLTVKEIFKAVLSLPIGFVMTNEQAIPVAIQGFKPGQNLLVTDKGQWIGRYVPAVYRGYPFSLGKTEAGEQLLCFDMECDNISDSEGAPFFEAGKPTEDISKILAFLIKIQNDRQRTESICQVLSQHNLIQPWPIQLKIEGKETAVEGFYRIDEIALNQLDVESFEKIRQAGALPLVYSQLLSMQHLQSLITILNQHEQKNIAESLDIDAIFDKKDDLFKF